MTTRVFLVGTDTGVGKTAWACLLLRRARARGLTAAPFKPAQTGPDQPSDADRLAQAADLDPRSIPSWCPLRYEPPLAPGVAHDPSPFVTQTPATDEPLQRVLRAQAQWLDHHPAQLLVVEGAGGLHVPMPGGTWQPAWVVALSDVAVVVGRAGLGTVNHTIATIQGLRSMTRAPLGFVLSCTTARHDPATAHNAAIIEQQAAIPHLGTLPYAADHEPGLADPLLDALLALA